MGVPPRGTMYGPAYSAVMYLSTMACRVPSAFSSSRAALTAASREEPFAMPMA